MLICWQRLLTMTQQFIPIAVYGSLRRGFSNHGYLSHHDAEFIGTGWINGFEMYSMIHYPMIVPGEGQVQVEVYRVSLATLARIDRLEGHPSFYCRQVTPVILDSQEALQAYVYIGTHDQIDGLEPVETGIWQKRLTVAADL